uniref:CopD family protein n=1 Tax=uncultured Jatrophihabitans sp. TaxID=1610747 RepID=UPI0035C96E5A
PLLRARRGAARLVADDHPGGDAAKVADTLRTGLGDGSYTASYRVISADSHPVAGTVSFVVGNGALVRTNAGMTGNDDVLTGAALDVSRWISYGGVALLGGAWLLLTVWAAGRDERRARRLVWTGWAAATVGALLELLVQGPYSAGDGLGRITDPSLLDATLHIDYGVLHCVRLVLLGLLAPLLAAALQPRAEPARRDVLAGVLGVGVLATFSGSGHAATTSPAWISLVLDVLHIGAMAVWLGGLIMLVGALLPRRDDAELRGVLPVFSRTAFVAVVVLAGSGTYAAWRGIGTVHAIFTTDYGVLVVVKIVLFIGILAVANLSRRLVRGRAVAYAMTATAAAEPVESAADPDADVSTERLRRAVYVEAMIGVAVLLMTAVLVGQPRGKEALAADYRQPITRTAPLGNGKHVSVTVDPGTHGAVDLTVTPDTTTESVTATATQHARQLGPITVPLRRTGTSWSGRASLPVAGAWEIDLTLTSGQYDAVTTDTVVDLH